MFSACAFCSALAMAERSNRSIGCAERLVVNLEDRQRLVDQRPRIRSMTSFGLLRRTLDVLCNRVCFHLSTSSLQLSTGPAAYFAELAAAFSAFSA